MKYLSVCSGIESATVAWHPLRWKPFAFAEIEKFPSAVLAHHYSDVPNLGDITRFKEWPDETIDIIVGGTPCQSFSVAGLRAGLADPRGNLALTFLAIADKYRPRWLLWENVPGVLSSDGGRDFGAFLGGLGQLGYGWSYRVLDAQYVRVDGFERAVPQRRRRVFVVGHLGDWRRAAAVLFERQSLLWDFAPRREAGERIAPTISSRPTGGGGLGTDFDCDGGLIASTGEVAHYLNAGAMGRIDYESETMIAHSLRADGFDASEDGTGRGTPLVPIAFQSNAGGQDGEIAHDVSITLKAQTGGGSGMPAIAFSCKDHGADADEIAPTLRAMGHDGSHANAGGQLAIAFDPTAGRDMRAYSDGSSPGLKVGTGLDMGWSPAVAFDMRGREHGSQLEGPHDTANIRAASGGSSRSYVAQQWAVRRLTPRECERLQAFPDGYTDIPWRGKSSAPDGPRYKALGNAMAVNVMRWIGRRIQLVDTLKVPASRQAKQEAVTGKRSDFPRNYKDLYATPRSAVEPLIPYLNGIKRFAEPCAGNGDLIEHLKGFGFTCGYRGDILTGRDALARNDYGKTDSIITNPPHSRDLMHRLIVHFQAIAPTWLLVDLDWLANKQAVPYLPCCSDVVVIGRVKWIPDSKFTGKENYCWLKFNARHRDGPRLHNNRNRDGGQS